MKKWEFTLGMDVSKKTLDFYYVLLQQHIRVTNDTAGFRVFKKWCKENQIDLKTCLIVLEHTGGYEYRFLQFCQSSSISYLRVPGLEIKRSLGITRGKNDKVDAKRIAEYADEKSNKLEASKPLNKDLVQMRSLVSFRKRLVRERAGLQATVKERKKMYECSDKDLIIKLSQRKINTISNDIKEIEAELMKYVLTNEKMKFNYFILTSIKGIGPVNALMTIVFTENFTSFPSAKAYAVYAGVVPFDHSSGTSIKGRKRVSHLANKEIKSELNQAAKSAINHDPELKKYAARKLENKPYPVVLNNVKYKLILRMFSLVKRGENYVENYQNVA
ncbi:MAG: IS110 family transposase [Ginsengibacter sp.]